MVDSIGQIKDLTSDLILSDETIQMVGNLLLQQMNYGLKKNENAKATVKMFPSYVRSIPDGSEGGPFLALDLGGTNFRILLITLSRKSVEMSSKIYVISQAIMTGTGDQLFDHIADCINQFMKDHDLISQRLALGFTFSFPCRQHGLTSAILMRWTKGFNCTGVVGEDVVKLLIQSLERRTKCRVEIVALVNDTVGTLMAIAHKDPNCLIGVIVGTGTNACYMEKLENVELWDGDVKPPQQVIINTEWGAFGDDGCIEFVRTVYDREIDEYSVNPGKQIYEKIISGMYLGELVRLVVLKLTQVGLLFGGEICENLETRGAFYTKYISEIEADTVGGADGIEHTKEVLAEIGVVSPTREDCLNVQYICSLISKRSAHLAAAGIATLIKKVNRPQITVAVDGSVYRYHPKFHNLMDQKIRELVGPEFEFKLVLSEDGSGKGAALVAAVAYRLKEN